MDRLSLFSKKEVFRDKYKLENSRRKRNFLRRQQILIILAASLHFLGAASTFFLGGKKLIDAKFNLFFHLLQFFSWWSVHTSILTIWVAIIIFKEREKKSPTYFSQFITLLATVYNLITFFFWIYCLFFLDVKWENSFFSDVQSVSWHLLAPFLTIFYFYLSAQTDQLRKKKVKTLSLVFLAPVFYFFYVYILAKINRPTSSLFPYMEKYPYFIFEWITEVRWDWFLFNFLIACLVFLSICSLIIWTNKITEQKRNKNK